LKANGVIQIEHMRHEDYYASLLDRQKAPGKKRKKLFIIFDGDFAAHGGHARQPAPARKRRSRGAEGAVRKKGKRKEDSVARPKGDERSEGS